MGPDLPPGRYDPPRRHARLLAGLVGGAVGLAALYGGYGLYARHQAGRLDAELTAYDVTTDSSVRITFTVVTRGLDGECQVRAKDRSGAETGAELVRVQASKQRSTVVTVQLPTRARAVAAELVGCRRVHP